MVVTRIVTRVETRIETRVVTMFEAGADTRRQPGGLRSRMERDPLAARDHAVGRNHAGEMAVLTGQVCALNETLAAQVFEHIGSTHREDSDHLKEIPGSFEGAACPPLLTPGR